MRKMTVLFGSIVFFFSMQLMAEDTSALGGERCGVCGTSVSVASNVFKIGEVTYACPGCGLTAMSFLNKERYSEVKAQDFLRRMEIDATKAWYVRNTEIGFCCEPNWLAFSTQEETEKFAKGFGGEVLDFETAIQLAPNDHSLGHAH